VNLVKNTKNTKTKTQKNIQNKHTTCEPRRKVFKNINAGETFIP